MQKVFSVGFPTPQICRILQDKKPTHFSFFLHFFFKKPPKSHFPGQKVLPLTIFARFLDFRWSSINMYKYAFLFKSRESIKIKDQ